MRRAPWQPLAGKWAALLFAFGLLNASLFAASILPLSTAHVICEGLGFEAGIDHKFSDAPIFYWLYTILIVGGRRADPDSARAAVENPGAFAGRQWHLAAHRADLHDPADQPAGPDGRSGEWAAPSTWSRG